MKEEIKLKLDVSELEKILEDFRLFFVDKIENISNEINQIKERLEKL